MNRMYQNVVEAILESVSLYKDNILIINHDETHTYHDLYIDASKIYKHISSGRILLRIKDKYLTGVSFVACLFKKALCFIDDASNQESPLLKYHYDMILTDEEVSTFLKDEDYELYSYRGDIKPLDPCVVLLSSGTSKEAKPIVLSHRGVITNILSGLKLFEVKQGWLFVNILPFNHAFGITSDFLDMIITGTTIVYSYSIFEFFSNLVKYRPDSINIPVSVLSPILEMLKQNGQASMGGKLKTILAGGSKCSQSIVDTFKQYNITICTSYGLTECSPCISINSPKYFKDGSDGKVFDCHHLTITDSHEIVVSGDSLMLNYLDEYDRGNIIDEFHTKDIGYVDEDGFIFVTGRLDNLIILDNGTKIQPETFEADLKNGLDVIDAVIYLKDKQLILDVVGDMNLETALKKKFNYLDLHINFVDEIKHNKMGKVDRAYYKNL